METPDYVPAEIRDEEPQTCKGCGLRIWWKHGSHLICHETPPCPSFIKTMQQMNGINLYHPKGEA